MDNNTYNSLTEKLIQNGILSSDNVEKDETQDLYGIIPDENMSNSPFVQPYENKTQQEEKYYLAKNKKRINEYDMDLINNPQDNKTNSIKTLQRFLNYKQNKVNKTKKINLEYLFFKLFPRLYKAQLAREAMKKYRELGIDVNELLNKTIPYGECEARYNDLVKYIVYANEIQIKMNKNLTK